MITLFATVEPINWLQIGQAIGGIAIGILIAYNTWRQSHIEKKVEAVRVQGNSNFGDMLQVGMVAAKTLAETTGKPEHAALAEVAEQRLIKHIRDDVAAQAVEKPTVKP